MRLVAHLSDLHFGAADPGIVAALLADLTAAKPDLVAISGDLTQRARASQFAEAMVFLERLPAPYLVVPGNHDLAPLYRPLSRLLAPRRRFHFHLGKDRQPLFADQEIAAIGLDSTRALRWKGGGIAPRQLDQLERRLEEAEADCFKIAVLHHPLSGHADSLADLGIDLMLTGHHHRSHAEIAGKDKRLLIAHATTAVSTRTRRAEGNGFNLIRIAGDEVEIEAHGFAETGFHRVRHENFRRDGQGWKRLTR